MSEKKRSGFSLIEAIVVTGIISIFVVLAGGLSSKVFSRRSVDNITQNIASTLQLVKLKAARQGVEYQAIFTYDAVEQTLEIVTERGDSNRGSVDYAEESSHTIKVLKGMNITPAARTFNFNPNGTLGGASGTMRIIPTTEANIKKCGSVVVSPFGRIRVIEGNWDGSNCDAIRDS
ncbi:MAG: pilus assembly FimT family protein [Deltaproteobacteria bacterium]